MITTNQALRPLLESRLPSDLKWEDIELLKCSNIKGTVIFLFQHKNGFTVTMEILDANFIEIQVKTGKKFDIEKLTGSLSKETALAFHVLAIEQTPEGQTSNEQLPRP